MTTTIDRRRFTAAMVGAGALAALPSSPVRAGPAADLWPRWQAHDPGSPARIDHTRWADFLSTYVHERTGTANRVDYAAVSASDRRRLQDYIAQLAALDIAEYDRNEQFAYWTNLYNALTVKVVLDHWPVDSIRDINLGGGGFLTSIFGAGPWRAKLIAVDGEDLSLDDIEHRILRPIWRDPRIHYVVNCAAIGCPDLGRTPYTAERLEAQLDAAARAYVNCPRGAEVEGSRLIVSKIYTWYQEDFGGTDQGVIDHLRAYGEPTLEARLAGIDRISGDRYDWSINAPSAPRGS